MKQTQFDFDKPVQTSANPSNREMALCCERRSAMAAPGTCRCGVSTVAPHEVAAGILARIAAQRTEKLSHELLKSARSRLRPSDHAASTIDPFPSK